MSTTTSTTSPAASTVTTMYFASRLLHGVLRFKSSTVLFHFVSYFLFFIVIAHFVIQTINLSCLHSLVSFCLFGYVDFIFLCWVEIFLETPQGVISHMHV